MVILVLWLALFAFATLLHFAGYLSGFGIFLLIIFGMIMTGMIASAEKEEIKNKEGDFIKKKSDEGSRLEGKRTLH
jgi:archaellum biogenesis protein FlaJ (TadC family)